MIALPGVAEARRMVPKYFKTATVYGAQQAYKLHLKTRSGFRARAFSERFNRPAKPVKPAVAPRVNLKDGDSYNAAGLIRRKLQGQTKNLRRVKAQTGTPRFGIIVR